MAHASPRLIFRSTMFAVESGEDEATNPGIFGKSLASWIGQELVPGFSAESIIAEDFAWLVPVPNPQHKLYIACSSVGDSSEEWSLMVIAEGGLMSRVLGNGRHVESVAKLYAAVKHRIERAADISEIHEDE